MVYAIDQARVREVVDSDKRVPSSFGQVWIKARNPNLSAKLVLMMHLNTSIVAE